MSMLLTLTAISNGVLAASDGADRTGFPEISRPPAGQSRVSLKGNCEVAEKFVTAISTLSYSDGLARIRFPDHQLAVVNVQLAHGKIGGEPARPTWAPLLFVEAPPRLEKFQVPLVALSNVICGCSSTISVTFSCFEKISGISSTPIFSDCAVINGDLLKAGSSAIAMLSP